MNEQQQNFTKIIHLLLNVLKWSHRNRAYTCVNAPSLQIHMLFTEYKYSLLGYYDSSLITYPRDSNTYIGFLSIYCLVTFSAHAIRFDMAR